MSTTSAYDLELSWTDDAAVERTFGLMLADPAGTPAGTPKTLHEQLAASDLESPSTWQLTPLIQEDWSSGIGVDYHAAYNLYTRTPGYVLPAGQLTTIPLPTTTHNTNTPLVAVEEYGGSLWVAQEGASATYGGRICRSTDGTGIAGGAFSNSKTFSAGDYVRDLIVFDYLGMGSPLLYASSSDVNGATGYLHVWNGTAWADYALGFGVNDLAKVFWVTKDGIGAFRLVTITGPTTIRYTLPYTDPTNPANWSVDIKVGTAYRLRKLVGSRRHIYASADDGLWDIDELGNAVNLTAYTERMIQTGNGVVAEYLNGFIYMGLGRGIDRVRVDQQGALQETPGQCGPGWGTAAENDVQGYPTAMCVDQGELCTSVYNPTTKVSYVCWGLDHEGRLSDKTRNPLRWAGPELTFGNDLKTTVMRTCSLAPAGDLRLWCGVINPALNQPPQLIYASLPVGGQPLQDLISGGPHRFHSGAGGACSLRPMGQTAGDQNALKIIQEHTFTNRGAGTASSKLTTYSRADPAPGSTAWGAGSDVSTSPIGTISPGAVPGTVSGHKLEQRIDLFSPGGGNTPPTIVVLDAIRTTVWKVVPSANVMTATVEYGAGVQLREGGSWPDEIDPDQITDWLTTLTGVARATLRDPLDRRWTVRLPQVLVRAEVVTGGQKRVRADIQIVKVAPLSWP